eukprot:2832896-Pleurochrysis_carterae.AAC.1
METTTTATPIDQSAVTAAPLAGDAGIDSNCDPAADCAVNEPAAKKPKGHGTALQGAQTSHMRSKLELDKALQKYNDLMAACAELPDAKRPTTELNKALEFLRRAQANEKLKAEALHAAEARASHSPQRKAATEAKKNILNQILSMRIAERRATRQGAFASASE